jgi:2-oxoglutarate ferredoxin oxidoreductase subunit gamma
MLDARILCAGFGGQGIMSMGQLLAYAGLEENRHVTWIPSYGPEMRGGTAYCSVVISAKEISCPIVTSQATSALIMNLPSLQKFEQSVESGGNIFLNSSLIDSKVERTDLHYYCIPARELAAQCGDTRAANMVMLGAYLGQTATVQLESIMKIFTKVFGEKSMKVIAINRDALHLGAETVHTVSERKKAV